MEKSFQSTISVSEPWRIRSWLPSRMNSAEPAFNTSPSGLASDLPARQSELTLKSSVPQRMTHRRERRVTPRKAPQLTWVHLSGFMGGCLTAFYQFVTLHHIF